MNATTIRYFRVIRPGSGWTAAGPRPDVVLSKHYAEGPARRAFTKARGPRVLEERQPDGTFRRIDSALA